MLKLKRYAKAILVTVFASLVMLGGTAHAKDRAYRVIHDFKGSSNGWEPAGVPAVAANGDLYGVTIGGGTSGLGTVFKLTAPRTRGGAWAKTILYDFPGGNGGGHPTSLVLGSGRNLYGVDFTQTLFELKRPTSDNGVWTYTALYTLNQGSQGSAIQGIALDAKGNIYGATELGGDLSCGNGYGCGTVFELKRPTRDGGKWRLSTLYAFTGNPDGAEPFAGVTLDQKGNVYGTTNYGGTYGYGTVYRVSPPTQKGGAWTETVLYSFNPGTNIGASPSGPLTFDGSGNIYGTPHLPQVRPPLSPAPAGALKVWSVVSVQAPPFCCGGLSLNAIPALLPPPAVVVLYILPLLSITMLPEGTAPSLPSWKEYRFV